MSKCLSVKYVLISQKSDTLVWANQKTKFWGFLGGSIPIDVKRFVS